MTQATLEKEITALLLIDPYNDFISEGGRCGVDENRCRGERLYRSHAAVADRSAELPA